METIGKDLIIYICLKLDFNSIDKLCLTSKYIRNLCNSYNFWRQKMVHDFPKIDISEVDDLKKLSKYLISKPKVIFTDKIWNREVVNDLLDRLEKGDVVKNGLNYHIKGVCYILNEKHFIPNQLSFPEYPPDYYKGILKNYQIRISNEYNDLENSEEYIKGKFGEIYKKENIYVSDQEDPYAVFEEYELKVYI